MSPYSAYTARGFRYDRSSCLIRGAARSASTARLNCPARSLLLLCFDLRLSLRLVRCICRFSWTIYRPSLYTTRDLTFELNFSRPFHIFIAYCLLFECNCGWQSFLLPVDELAVEITRRWSRDYTPIFYWRTWSDIVCLLVATWYISMERRKV